MQEPLPLNFDDRCKNCEKPMERMKVSLLTEMRPYAHFYCTSCPLSLYIFKAPRKPFLLWSDKIRGVVNFSKFVAEEIDKREKEHVRDLAREKAVLATV